jgi:basic amino acid/polyamine antiporter, APA family
VNLRTRAIVARDVAKTILGVLEEERADELFLGWRGKRSAREHVLGSTLDPILLGAECQVTLFHAKKEDVGSVVALAGPGPHSPVALRRAYEVSLLGGEKPTFVNVQPTTTRGEDGQVIDPQERGEETTHSIAAKGGLTEDQYTARVLVDDNIREAILAVIQDYDTVCVGMSTQNVFQRVFFGPLAERIARAARGNVLLVRGPQEKRWSIHEALIERFAKREREPT